MGDKCNRDNQLGDRSSTRLFHADAHHHSKSSWSLGWSGPSEDAAARPSANRFATGSNQNAGNVLTDKPTTRVVAPPGGRSSDIFNLGPAPATESSNRFATGSNPNAGNVLSERPTTRVHAPPGGHSSIRFG